MCAWIGILSAAIALFGWVACATAATIYHVRLRPTGAAGLQSAIAFDLTHSDSASLNYVDLLSFSSDGRTDSAEVEGGPGHGDLISAANPAALTTLEGQYFYNSLSIPFDSLGSLTSMSIDITERPPAPAYVPDELAMYLIRRSTGLPYPTADGLGTDALFAIDITGEAGGELSVFSPMAFIAPDTLVLEGALVSVATPKSGSGRLRFRSVAPVPSSRSVSFAIEVPEPGGPLRVRVYDVSGRLLAEPYCGNRTPGTWTTHWDGTDSKGHAVAAGLYIVQLQMAGQSVVRRVVLTR